MEVTDVTAKFEYEHETTEEGFPFALSSHDVKIPFDTSKSLLPFSDGGVASVAYTSCSESIGTNNSSFLHDRPSLSSLSQISSGLQHSSTTPSTIKIACNSSHTQEQQQHEPSSEGDNIASSLTTRGTSVTASSSILHNHSGFSNESGIREETSQVPRGQLIDRSLRGSLNFSQLMERADDTLPSVALTQSYYMPPLVEENEEGQQWSQSSSSSSQNGWFDAMNAMWTGDSRQSLPNPSASLVVPSPKKLSPSLPSFALADTFGAKITLPDGIEACQMSATNMEVRLVLSARSQSMQDPEISSVVPSVREVMDVISNPELLRVWCEPISAVIVTSTSDGARGISRHCPEQDRGRMYDGEWIEGTTNMLVSPSSHLHYFYTLGNILWSSLGFPSYGKLTMFVERQRGQVGLTLGPFPDGLVASHTFTVRDEENGSVSVVDKLEMRYENNDDDSSCHCNLLEPLEHLLFSSKNQAYLEQSVSSMRHLRDLLQEGGEVGAYVVAPLSEKVGETDAMVMVDEEAFVDTTANTPLLGSSRN